MLLNYFNSGQKTLLFVSGILIFFSILYFNKNNKKGIILLFLGTLVLNYFIINLDPFLKLWDEQYHALVAKNLSENFFKPLLYKENLIKYQYQNWTANSIWLHKQPLFLWKMALSIKLFGANEFAVRLPSLILHSIIPIFIFRIGKLTVNKYVGYYGALLFAVAYFPLELTAGFFSTDHNDICFLFYITASCWCWFEYNASKKNYWLILMAVFSGLAVLTKWLMGLLVYIIWGIVETLSQSKISEIIKSYLLIIKVSLLSFFIFLPWQIFIFLKYPKEALYEIKLNSRHFFEVIEGHSQTTFYYFNNGLKSIYGSGDFIPFILLIGVILLIYKTKNIKSKIFISAIIIFVYIFFTFSKTKMVSFTVIVSPLIYLGLGSLIYLTLEAIKKYVKIKLIYKISLVIIPLLLAFICLNLTKITNNHTMWKAHDNDNRIGELIEKDFINSLNTQLKNEKYIIFNTTITVNGHIPIMFYTDYSAYNFIPTESQINNISSKNYKIAVLNIGEIPDYIIKNKSIKILEVKYKNHLK